MFFLISSAFAFALGAVLEIAPNVILGSFWQFLFRDIVKLDVTLVSYLWSGYSVVRAFLILVIGFVLSKCSLSRRVWLLCGSVIPLCFGFALCFFPNFFCTPQWALHDTARQFAENNQHGQFIGSHPLYVASLFLALLVFAFGSVLFSITRMNFFSELFGEDQRPTVLGIQQVVSVVAVLFSIVFTPTLSGDPVWSDRDALAFNTSVIFFICGIFASIACVVLAKKLGANNQTKSDQPLVAQGNIFQVYFSAIRESAACRQLIIAWCFLQLALMFVMSSTPLYFKSFFPDLSRTPLTDQLDPIAINVFGVLLDGPKQVMVAQALSQLATIVATGFWMKLLAKKTLQTTWQFACIAFALSLLVQMIGPPVNNGQFTSLLIFQILVGGSMSAIFFLPMLAMARVSEQDTMATGKQRASVFQGLCLFSLTASGALQGYISGEVLEQAGYDPDNHSEQATQAIGFLSVYLPSVLFVCSALAMFGFEAKTSDTKQKRSEIKLD